VPVLPVDPAIPALTEMAARGVEPVLADLGFDAPSADVRVLKYHEGSRITFVARDGFQPVAVKCFADGAAPLIALHQWFDAAGLATGRPPTVPPLRAADENRQVMVTAWVHGAPAAELVANGRGAAAGALAASWLTATDARLQTARFGPPGDRAATLLDADRYVRTITKRERSLEAAAAAVRNALVPLGPGPEPLGVRHGGYYLTHVFDVDGGPAVIDWDTFCQAPLELDAGMFLAMTSRWATTLDAPADVPALRASFLDGISGVVDTERLAFYQGACLLKMVSFLARRQPAGWTGAATTLLEEARAVTAG